MTAKPTMKKFDEIIVPSQFLVDVFAKFDLQAEVIFNLVESENFKFRERNPLQPVFLSNRNFESHYQVSDILRAFQIIQNKYSRSTTLHRRFRKRRNEIEKISRKIKVEERRISRTRRAERDAENLRPRRYLFEFFDS